MFSTRHEAKKPCLLVNKYKVRTNVFFTRAYVKDHHRKMPKQELRTFHVAPDCNSNIMKQRQQTLFDATCDVPTNTKGLLTAELPGIVLAHGGNTSLCHRI